MGKLSTINYFIYHSYLHGSEEDKRFANFMVWNELKGVLIFNSFTFMLFLTRFKTYRNSHLLLANGFSSILGLVFAAEGLGPLLVAHNFHQAVPVSILEDPIGFGKSSQLVGDTLSLMYLEDL